MNILRQSFIMALMKDPDLKSRTSYEELFLLVDEHFIQGIKENLTEKEDVIKKSNIFFYKLINNIALKQPSVLPLKCNLYLKLLFLV